MRLYRGETPCPGCDVPGSVRSRTRKSKICPECERLIELGKGVKAESNGYSIVGLRRYSLGRTTKVKFEDWSGVSSEMIGRPYYVDRPSGEFVKSLQSFLSTLDEGQKADYDFKISQEDAWSDDQVVLRTESALAFFEFLGSLKKYTEAIAEKRLQEGKNLLLSLAEGRMLISDFDAKK